jgi:hypothetical protein
MSEARARVSLTDGVLEFEGSESFVTSQVEKFTKIIQAALAGERPTADDAAAGGGGGTTDGDGKRAEGDTQAAASAPLPPDAGLNDIFEATEAGVQLLRPLPGSSKPEKAVNAAKLYLYGLQALKQRDTALFAEIKNVCKAHHCYDSNNMAAYLKGDQASFVFGGQGKRQTLKLSAPGMHATAELIARIRTRGNGIVSKRKGIDRVASPKASRAMGSSQRNMGSSPCSMGSPPRSMASSRRDMATLVKSPR